MDATILLFLIQDGITNGAIYALLGIALVLVFTVTRVIFVPQGEFVAYGALTLAMLDTGKVPGTVGLLLVFGVCAFLSQLWNGWRDIDLARLGRDAAFNLLLPAAIAAMTFWLAPMKLPPWASVALTLVIIAPMGPYLYAIAFRPIAEASVLTLFIVSIGVHLAMTGLGLVFFGAEGFRARPLTDVTVPAGPLVFTGQTLSVYAVTLVSMLALSFFFHKPLFGKALRATAVNRLGARLVGISASLSGSIAFGLAAILGALSGALIAPIATVFYDSGFIIGLKGFIAAIIGSLASYPLTALAAIGVGLVESFASFHASYLKEVIVFTLIIPVLIWLSFAHGHTDEED
ncbi:branched-chain amino acid ABC transporter permease [Roseiarcaceae bacterium H3SJ34-1]|uniref:branched-chain amino acid ABC transporter permease n=1 Tax=Terripilifer ovatus TaxID=3032367 RepID=UPI003AB96129|nr:branched-chain amino acid ABC transporter permease [Roseiarcaceae bacterium H3SJ34-1]